MSAVTVPDALTAPLAAAVGPVELKAADGRVLGRFVPNPHPTPPKPLIPWEPDITCEELQRRLDEPGLTIDEVRERMGWT